MPYYGPLPQLVVGQSASRLAVSDPGLSATLQNFQVGADPYVPPAQWTATADAYTAGGFLRSRNVAGAPILSRAIEGSGLYVFEASFEQPEGAIRILDTLGGALIINPQGAAGPLVLYHDSPANQPAAFQYGVLSAVCAIKGELNLTTGHLKLYTKRDGVDSDFVFRFEATRAGRTFNGVTIALSAAANLRSYADAVPLPVTISNPPEGSVAVVGGVEYDPTLPFNVATAGSLVWLIGEDGAALALPCFAKFGNILVYEE